MSCQQAPNKHRAPNKDREESHDALLHSTIGGRYRIESKIRDGGMGRVYLATHIAFDELHALKVLHPNANKSQLLQERFLIEAQLARRASLQSPFIVTIYDFGYEQELGHYLSMEYISGAPLTKYCHPKNEAFQLSPRDVVGIVAQVCQGMHAAHSLGILHRDIKPSNILLTPDEEGLAARIIDFGIAQSLDRLREEFEHSGAVVGTPSYMAPEQIMLPEERDRLGWPLDARADIYALGVCMYRALTGRLPFVVKSQKPANHKDVVRELWRMQVEEAPAAPELIAPHRAIPTRISAIVLKALEKSPLERFSSMLEFHDALIAATSERDASFRPKRPPNLIRQPISSQTVAEDTRDCLSPAPGTLQRPLTLPSFFAIEDQETTSLASSLLLALEQDATSTTASLECTPFQGHNTGGEPKPTRALRPRAPSPTQHKEPPTPHTTPTPLAPIQRVLLCALAGCALVLSCTMVFLSILQANSSSNTTIPAATQLPPMPPREPRDARPNAQDQAKKRRLQHTTIPKKKQRSKLTKHRYRKARPRRRMRARHRPKSRQTRYHQRQRRSRKRKRRKLRNQAKQRARRRCFSPRRGGRTIRLLSPMLRKLTLRTARQVIQIRERGCVYLPPSARTLTVSYRPDPTAYYPCYIRLSRRKTSTLRFSLVSADLPRPLSRSCSKQ